MKENRRILVVDDDSGIREIFAELFAVAPEKTLMEEGKALFGESVAETTPAAKDPWEIVLAENGEAGILAVREAVAAQEPFAMVFMDMKMPGMDGAAAARGIWSIDPRVKIVIVTAYSQYRPEEISLIAGREEIFYLRKPFTRDEIRQFARSLVFQWNLERERDRLQEELQQANLHLEEKIAERTRELQRANSRLAVLNSEKMTFLEYLSHEMNTPLNWIGAVGIIELDTLTEADCRMIDCVEKGFDRLSNLVQAVLDYFTMAGTDLAMDRKKIALREILLQLVNASERTLLKTGVCVEVQVKEDLTVEACSSSFYELLETLLNNALEYSEPGGIVRIRTGQAGDARYLEVVDQGKGIPRENLKNIFRAFATKSFDRREDGFGLNLPMARLIAESHGWSIRAESEGPGKGSRLVVEGI